MKYILFNIRNLAKYEKFIFAVMIICVFVSAWIMTFSYGLYQNFYVQRKASDETGKAVYPDIADGEGLTYGEYKAYLEALPDELLAGINMIVCQSVYEYESAIEPGKILQQRLVSRFVISNGVYHQSSYVAERWGKNGVIIAGNYISDNDEMLGNNVVMIVQEDPLAAQLKNGQHANLYPDDYTAMIYGKEYKIIAETISFGLVVPFLSVPAETLVERVIIQFEKSMTTKIYAQLIEIANDVIPGKLIFPELELPDRDEMYIYNNIIMISVLIASLAIVNFAFLYNYIFGKRRRQLAIMRICGCTVTHTVGICLGECCLICIPMFLAGMLTYIPFMKRVLSPLFKYIEASYSAWVYVTLFGIYIIMLIAIISLLILGQIRKTLAEGRKDGI